MNTTKKVKTKICSYNVWAINIFTLYLDWPWTIPGLSLYLLYREIAIREIYNLSWKHACRLTLKHRVADISDRSQLWEQLHITLSEVLELQRPNQQPLLSRAVAGDRRRQALVYGRPVQSFQQGGVVQVVSRHGELDTQNNLK